MKRAPTCEVYAFEGTRWHAGMGTRGCAPPLVTVSTCPRVTFQGRKALSAFKARSLPSVSPISGTG